MRIHDSKSRWMKPLWDTKPLSHCLSCYSPHSTPPITLPFSTEMCVFTQLRTNLCLYAKQVVCVRTCVPCQQLRCVEKETRADVLIAPSFQTGTKPAARRLSVHVQSPGVTRPKLHVAQHRERERSERVPRDNILAFVLGFRRDNEMLNYIAARPP